MNISDKIRKKDPNSTVFTISDIQTSLGIVDPKVVYNATSYAVEKGYFKKISKGIFAFDEHYSRIEFANKFRTPSYVSLYTVLTKEGVVFQPYESIYAISNRSEKVNIHMQQYIYRKLKEDILLNPLGIVTNKHISIATKERAICDKLYLDGDEFFDNLRNIDWDLLEEINQKVFSNNSVIEGFISKSR